ncbi:MAG: hypothetical protein LDLANPLL_00921 [Turneriella sp.]|nr:hypothetical protein [Turneriella sp.]
MHKENLQAALDILFNFDWFAKLALPLWRIMGSAKITATNENAKYRVRIANGTHTVYADEPLPQGGGDTGLNPYELLLSSLGACTAITLRMYAERKGWDTGKISTETALTA